MSEYLFIQPVDVLYVRGNRLFGEAGHAQALMPPWPSLAAGAIRSRMLADSGVDLAAFAAGKDSPEGSLGQCLGTPASPGTFRINRFLLGKKVDDGTVEPFLPLPADVTTYRTKTEYLQPRMLHPDLTVSCKLPLVPVLRQDKPEKPLGGCWLNRKGISAYLAGDPLLDDYIIGQQELWENDPRLGIAMDPVTRTAAEGRIYTTETVALKQKVGFLVNVEGAAGCLPHDGLLRFGGDGRSATVSTCRVNFPQTPWGRIAAEERFRLVLATPGIFDEGWLLPRLDEKNGNLILRFGDCKARLAAAAFNRAEVVSGWDLAKQSPKHARRAAATGSVYWLDRLEGNVDGLRSLIEAGLCTLMDDLDPARRAEGFNNVFIAAWPRD